MAAKEKRLIHHSFKITESEDALLQQKMKTLGVSNLSAFVRKMTFNGYMLKVDYPEIHELLRLFKNLTNNSNQMAKRLHELGLIYETEMDDLIQEQHKLWIILNRMLERLK